MPSLRRYTEHRASASRRGYGRKWRMAALAWLKQHPDCAMKAPGCITKAIVVDHKVPWDGNSKLFWDTNNWQSLCVNCHNVKTGAERAAKNATKPTVLRYDERGRPTDPEHFWNQRQRRFT